MKARILLPHFFFAAILAILLLPTRGFAQSKEIVWSADEQPLHDQIRTLRSLPDDVRARTTKDLALKIRRLPATENKLRLALGLANLSTEGDFGQDTLQEVANTLALTLKERPAPWEKDEASGKPQPAAPYMELAMLARYEHVQVAVDDPQFAAAIARFEADDQKRQHPEFTLKDLRGTSWTFGDLRGKVVLVNFWATWCPPCRKEMPDLESLYTKFRDKGRVVLAISDEDAAKVTPFIQQRGITFPVLLDPDRKVNDLFVVYGIPKTFIYDREGKLVAQSIDMRTQDQFLEMLKKAGIE